MSIGGRMRNEAAALRFPRGRGLLRVLLAAVLVVLMASGSAGTNAQVGAPALELEYEVTPAVVSTVSDELTVEITVAGKGGRAGDLPLEIRENLPRRPLEVVLVLDRSGSMEYDDYQPTRIEAAKAAARTFLKQIQAGDSTALVSFNDRVALDVPLTEDRDLSLESLRRLQPADGTAIGEGLYRAIEVLENGADESVKAIVLLSDGASNEGRDPRRAADAAREAGIPVFTVGIGTPGDEFDEPTLQHIAEVTGGEYLYAPDEEELSQVYERMGGKVINVAGVNASLEIEVTELFELGSYTPEDLESGRGGRLVYRWDQVPVGETKTILLQGWPTAAPAGERAAVINSITLNYQSLGSDRVRTVFAGPVTVEFEDLTERGPLEIERISLDRIEAAYSASNVYFQNDDIRADIHLDRRPREDIVSIAWAQHSQGLSEISRELSGDDTISHRFEHPGYVGRYNLTGTIGQDIGRVYDTHEEELFVVFEPPRRFQNFAQSTTFLGDLNESKRKVSGFTDLHPRHARILEAMADLLTLKERPTDLSDPMSAAEVLALDLKDNLVIYPREADSSNTDHPSDLAILDAGLGDCTDMAALFTSMARSLNIPVRNITFRGNFPDGKGGYEENGHAISEVHVDGEWVHADPTWYSFDHPDIYFERDVQGMKFKVETSPGVLEYDRLLTLKYSVGLISPHRGATVRHDLDDGDDIKLRLELGNMSTEGQWFFDKPKAKDVRIRVIDDAGLDIERPRLDNGPELDPGERDTAELEIRVPDDIADDVPPGGQRMLNIELELEYGDGAGGTITKTYPYTIRLHRGA